MIKANATIIAGDRMFSPGQTVTGLSRTDIGWMKKAGYITETAAREKKPPDENSTEKEAADEL